MYYLRGDKILLAELRDNPGQPRQQGDRVVNFFPSRGLDPCLCAGLAISPTRLGASLRRLQAEFRIQDLRHVAALVHNTPASTRRLTSHVTKDSSNFMCGLISTV